MLCLGLLTYNLKLLFSPHIHRFKYISTYFLEKKKKKKLCLL